MTGELSAEDREPLLIKAARRMAETHPHRHIRIVSGSGTTVGGFVQELDEWLAARAEAAEARLANVEALLTEAARAGRRATLDPGAFVKRGPDPDGRSHGEHLDQWQERALLAAVAALAPTEGSADDD